MTKQDFINRVSKINETFEDEFKAEYNSPELLWEKVIVPMFMINTRNKNNYRVCPHCKRKISPNYNFSEHKKVCKEATKYGGGKWF